MRNDLQKIINKYWIPLLGRFLEDSKQNNTYEPSKTLSRKLRHLLQFDDYPCNENLDEILSLIVKHTPNVWDSRYMNYLYSSPDPIGLIGDWLISLLNTNVHAYEASPVFSLIENQMILKLTKLIGYDNTADGVFFPGASYCNMYAIFLSRKKVEKDINNFNKLVIFTSEQSHYSIDKAASILGINIIRKIPCDKKGRMIPEKLNEEIEQALRQKEHPLFINATIGTTVLGAFDPLEKIYEIASKYSLWLHIDAAWGGISLFSDEKKSLFNSIENADSVTLDFHKALRSPILCSCLLLKEGKSLNEAFQVESSYLVHGNDADIGLKTPQCGRRADAFKIWLMWKIRGKNYFSQLANKIYQWTAIFIHHLKTYPCFKIYDENPEFCNICFWYIPKQMREKEDINNLTDDEKSQLDKITVSIYDYMKRDGNIMVNYAQIDPYPKFFRAVPGNLPSQKDILEILDTIESIGNVLTQSLSEILISGGDTRLQLDDTNKNYIMISPKPAPNGMISRSSCTGTFISEENYTLLNDLLTEARSFNITFKEFMTGIHQGIRNALNLDYHTSIVTIPSGTDSEYIPILIAKAYAGYDQSIVNLITGAGEVGTNSPIAAEGRYFSESSPSGQRVEKGKRVGGIGENIEVITISNKELKSDSSNWKSYTEQFLSSQEKIVLLHIVDSSKLGRRLNSLEDMRKLREQYPRNLFIIIDSCQSRTDTKRTRHYLQLGFMVMITGSKFEEGPPFSGAVLIPTNLTDTLNKNNFSNLLPSLRNYITSYDVSGDLEMIKDRLPLWMNWGLMMRWACALNNWHKFKDIEETERNALIQSWVKGILKLIDNYPEIDVYCGGESQSGAVGEINTIISVRLISKNRLLSMSDLKKIYTWLNTKMSPHIDLEDSYKNSVLDTIFLIGQPVQLPKFAVLRIALGATLVNDLKTYGLEKILEEDKKLLTKISILVKNFEKIDTSQKRTET